MAFLSLRQGARPLGDAEKVGWKFPPSRGHVFSPLLPTEQNQEGRMVLGGENYFAPVKALQSEVS